MPKSQLEIVTDQFYSNLDTLDKHTVRRMAIAHRIAIKNLNAEFSRISAIIAKDTKLGLDSGAYILQQQRLASFIGQARTQFEKFGSVVGETIADTQLQAAKLAEKTIPNMVEAINGPAPLGFAFNRFPEAAFQQMVGHLTDGSPLATLTKSFGDDAATKLNAILANGMATGLGVARARTIARTEMLRAYRESSRRTFLANADVVLGWRWHSALDDRTCAVCYAMHGRTFKLQASMATHPNCRCVQIPITKPWKDLGFKGVSDLQLPYKATIPGETWFKGLSQLQQRKVLGRGGQLAYEKGLVKLDDFVQDTYSPQWGYGRVKKSLRSIVGTDNARLLSRGIVPKTVQTNNTSLRLMLVEDNPFQRQLDFMERMVAEKRLLQSEADLLEITLDAGHYANAGEFQAAIEGIMDAPYRAFEQSLDDAVAKFGFDKAIADDYKLLASNADREYLEQLRKQATADIQAAETTYQAALSQAKNDAWPEVEKAKWLGNLSDSDFADYQSMWNANKLTPQDWNHIAQDMAYKNSGIDPMSDLAAVWKAQFDAGIIDQVTFDSLNQQIIGNYKAFKLSDIQSMIVQSQKKLDDYAPVGDVFMDIPNEWAKVTQLFNDKKLTNADAMAFKQTLIGKPKIEAIQDIDNFVAQPKFATINKSSAELLSELDATYLPFMEKNAVKAQYKAKTINKAELQTIIDDAIKNYPPPPTPQPSIATMPPTTINSAFQPPALSELTFVQDLGGSTGAQLFQDVAGNRYVVKRGNSLDHLLSESRADRIYQELGIDVPRHTVVNGDTKIAEFIPGRTLNQLVGAERDAAEAVLRENFVVDAFLGNWDVIGLNADNVLVDNAGKVFRIDNGGSLSFRAQGAKKASNQWNEVVSELDTMRNKQNVTGNIYKSVTDADIIAQIDNLVAQRNNIFNVVTSTGGFDDANVLMKRLDYLEDWAAKKKAALNQPTVNIVPQAQKNITQQIELPKTGLLDETDSLPFLDFAEQAGYITDVQKADFLGLIQSEGWTSIKVGSETTKFLKANGVPDNALKAGKPFRLPHGGFNSSADAWSAVNDAYAHGLVDGTKVKNLVTDGVVNIADPDDVQAAKLHAWLKSEGIPEANAPVQGAFATIDDAMQAVKDGYYNNKVTYAQYKKIQKQYWKAQHPGNWHDALTPEEFIELSEKRLGIKRPKAVKATKTPFKKHVDKMDQLLKSGKLNQRQYNFILDEYANGRWANKDIDAILSQYDKASPNYGGTGSRLPARFVPTEGNRWHEQWDHQGFMYGKQYGYDYKDGRGYTWFKQWKSSVSQDVFQDTRYYTDDYAGFNSWLRNGRDQSHYNAASYNRRIANMDKAFASPAARTTEEMAVYRRTNIRDNHSWWNAQPGDIIQDDAVLSTSAGERAAFSGRLNFIAYVPEDANAIWIAPESYHKAEREVIFKAGQQWIVHHKEIKTGYGGSQEMTLVVEYIETP